jgi:hypothetical protein
LPTTERKGGEEKRKNMLYLGSIPKGIFELNLMLKTPTLSSKPRSTP